MKSQTVEDQIFIVERAVIVWNNRCLIHKMLPYRIHQQYTHKDGIHRLTVTTDQDVVILKEEYNENLCFGIPLPTTEIPATLYSRVVNNILIQGINELFKQAHI